MFDLGLGKLSYDTNTKEAGVYINTLRGPKGETGSMGVTDSNWNAKNSELSFNLSNGGQVTVTGDEIKMMKRMLERWIEDHPEEKL